VHSSLNKVFLTLLALCNELLLIADACIISGLCSPGSCCFHRRLGWYCHHNSSCNSYSVPTHSTAWQMASISASYTRYKQTLMYLLLLIRTAIMHATICCVEVHYRNSLYEQRAHNKASLSQALTLCVADANACCVVACLYWVYCLQTGASTITMKCDTTWRSLVRSLHRSAVLTAHTITRFV
jgi:hypothetical protein